MPETETRTHLTQVGTVMVPVSDQDRAIDFYVEKLGLEKRSDSPFGNGDRWVEVAPQGAATTVALVLPRADHPEEAPGIETRIALTSEDIDADHASLRSRGVDVDDEVMRMGDPVPPMFFLRDQDGNRLLIVARAWRGEERPPWRRVAPAEPPGAPAAKAPEERGRRTRA
jgi:catechol 2,3-dioxygenase-like lactoylglutathione lyase family enzyme